MAVIYWGLLSWGNYYVEFRGKVLGDVRLAAAILAVTKVNNYKQFKTQTHVPPYESNERNMFPPSNCYTPRNNLGKQ